MFVTACNVPYLPYAELMIHSLRKAGKVDPRHIAVIAFGDPDECRFLEAVLKKRFTGIEVVKADLLSPRFSDFREVISEGAWALFVDFLRAWVGRHLKRYIWLDSDIIVRKNLSELRQILSKCDTIMMAKCHQSESKAASDKFYRLSECYVDMYKSFFGSYPRVLLNERRLTANMNSGVLVIDRSYDRLWKKIFVELGPYWNTKFKKAGFSPVPYGQGIWNLIFWHVGGIELGHEYNSVVPFRGSGAFIDHYSLDSAAKSAMLKEAVRLNLY